MSSPFEERVRARFPALKRDQVYLDNAGGSQTLDTVIDSIRDYLVNDNVQLGASYTSSRTSTALYSSAYERAAGFLNARGDEVVFAASATQLLRNLSYALRFRPGDEIVVSVVDHEANVTPWVDLAHRENLVIKWWRPSLVAAESTVNPTLSDEGLRKLLSDRTKLVTCTHASNVLGTVVDVASIATAAHQVGAMVCVDGVAYAPHHPIDVKKLGADFYVISWYKVFGPHISMLYASWAAQTNLRSLGHCFKPAITLADKLGLAGESYELLQAIPHVVDYIDPQKSTFWNEIITHEEQLQTNLIEYLLGLPDITLYGSEFGSRGYRVPIVSFTIKGRRCKDVVEAIEAKTNLGLRWGAMYSDRLIRDILGLGPDGVIRVSLVHYNTVAEVEAFKQALDDVIGNGE
ncbi:Aminotransferase-like protein FGM3 [Cladobotryum mycophilum]|uniref:Aminotransferase-like protein FGM3 n=1 Tax=Cladobotryum mycophilum TaxID=491253 RepID=A0ABR0SG12_9HYPO